MGTYYDATALIGYKIVTSRFHRDISVPSCSHAPPTEAMFCPTCGVRIGLSTRRIAVFEEESFYEFYNDLPDGYVYEYAEDVCWIGYGASVGQDCDKFRPLKPYDEIKIEIAEMLRPWTHRNILELKDENFGLWSINAGH